MSEKFPYGYDLNAYIDEHMKADFPWATRDMIAEHTCFGIDYVGRADLERDPRIKEFLGFSK